MSTILVIEDDPTQRLLTVATLRKSGHQVIEAVDGESGLESARAHKPDLIVCDVLMPGLNGYQVVTALRSDPELADTPVILLTSLGDRAHVRAGMSSGADDYLAKPFRSGELMAAIDALVAKSRLQRNAVIDRIKGRFVAALEAQRQSLALRFEKQLEQEVNAKWEVDNASGGDRTFEHATVFVVDLFGELFQGMPAGPELAGAVRSAYLVASDTVVLFGARHVQPYGSMLLAIFATGTTGPGAQLQALRAAGALLKAARMAVEPGAPSQGRAVPAAPALAIGIHHGRATVLTLDDPLRGSRPMTTIVGEAVRVAVELARFARGARWSVACTAEVTDAVPGVGEIGRTALVGSYGGIASVVAQELLTTQ